MNILQKAIIIFQNELLAYKNKSENIYLKSNYHENFVSENLSNQTKILTF